MDGQPPGCRQTADIDLAVLCPYHFSLVGRAFYFYFFLSGLAGLIYEVLWVRLFVLVMGGTVYSFTTVLAAFMTGLALGGWLGGRYADRMKSSPLLVYGALEGLIGVYCLLIPFMISALNPVFDALYPFISGHNSLGLLVRFLFSGIILIMPTTMMGATLPILVRYSYSRPEEFGRITGRLYSLNTLGAVFGSFISGMVMIPAWGQRLTLYLTAGINLLIFASITALWRFKAADFKPAKAIFEKTEEQGRLNFRAGLVLVFYGLSGAAAMIYQVAWTRALILSLGTTLYVLSLILTAFIAGLGMGAVFITGFADRLRKLWLWIGIFELMIGVFAWLVVPAFARLPLWMGLAHRPKSYSIWLAIEFLAGLAFIFLPTFLMGALLPLVVRLYAALRGGVGSAVGGVYAGNTIGAILGSLVCGFFLISWLGIRDSLILASILSVVIGAVFILAERGIAALRIGAAPAALIAAWVFVYFAPGWRPEIINSGPYIYFESYRAGGGSAKDLANRLSAHVKVLFFKEGAEASVSVIESSLDHTIGLRINGKIDASTGSDMTTQVLTGHLPFLLNPEAKNALVIGLASGVTMGSALGHRLKEVTCVEISPEVREASVYFALVNQRPLEDKRARLIINDGRYHLQHTSERYDVIISEPSNPWIGGMGLLFTREFFEQAKARLNPNGIMLAWIGIYDLDVDAVRMIMRTFQSVFPQATLWESISGNDYLLLGFNGPASIDYSLVKAGLKDLKLQRDLARIGLERPEKIISRLLMGPDELREFSARGPLHTDDLRQLELSVPRIGYLKSSREKVAPTLKAFAQYRVETNKFLKFSDQGDEKDLKSIDEFFDARRLIMNASVMIMSGGSAAEGAEQLERAYEKDPEDPWLKDVLYAYYYQKGQKEPNFEKALADFIKAWQYDPKASAIPAVAGFYSLGKGDIGEAARWDDLALSKNPFDSLAWLLRGKIELEKNKPELAFGSFARAESSFEKFREMSRASPLVQTFLKNNPIDLRAEIYFHQGESLRRLGKNSEALNYYEQALSISPDDVEAIAASGKMFMDLGSIDSALKRFARAAELDPQNPFIRLLYAQALEKSPGQRQAAIRELNKFLSLAPKDFPGREKAEKDLARLLTGR